MRSDPQIEIHRDVAPPLCANGSVVPSSHGLNYTLYCDLGITGDDHGTPTVQSFQDCVDGCTKKRPACFAAVWDPDGEHCYHRYGNFIAIMRNLVGRTGLRSAVVSASQMGERQNVSDHQCPYPNLSRQKTKTGMEFQVLCGAYIRHYGDPVMVHTLTMEDCMERCAEHHPFCNAISFNTDIIGSGWLNCMIEVGADLVAVPYTRTLAHSAIFVEHPLEIAKCRNDSVVRSQDGRVFRTSCTDLRKLDDANMPPISTSHEISLERCLKTCTKANSTCMAIIFDDGLQQGFQNCYLFDGVPPVNIRDNNVTFVYHESLFSHYQSPPPVQKVPQRRAWIASAVVSPIVGFALLFALIWYCLKRKRSTSEKKCKKLS
ncbi:uncharacterized protein K460DRAFT_102953 [Cucurbitaria berberidis CBS 394.84]|uniref:Apple domain-containing protein n=1 Tax=Cucurbitaria berberidis CBS 394.84 TaxID=1168544 RepID=A0A9P4L7L3_9PLEO|nr:uncharacterized protein K460DRAFT_102953 [Cucurbitaria berberidis CBS 394.84]KAF1845090.1 hypothetical protein K460DRAFT_102953 [Cucurbitaria berberidis CBS 394.84]